MIDITRIDHPFLSRYNKTLAVVAITSDSGLLGGLNMQVVNRALVELKNMPGRLIVIGERGKAYLRDSKIPFVAFSGIKDEDRYVQAMQLRDYVTGKVLEGAFGSVKVVYPRPISFTVQRVDMVEFLPFLPSTVEKSTEEVVRDIIMESRPNDIIEYLIHLWIGQRFYDIFGLSRLAEFAARYVHLEESLQKLRDMDSKLRLQYFRVRHELIDRTMRELFSARLLYASQ
jgi:ATP synthase F1 gamma subunit